MSQKKTKTTFTCDNCNREDTEADWWCGDLFNWWQVVKRMPRTYYDFCSAKCMEAWLGQIVL